MLKMKTTHFSENVIHHSSLKVSYMCGWNYWGLSVWKVDKAQTSYSAFISYGRKNQSTVGQYIPENNMVQLCPVIIHLINPKCSQMTIGCGTSHKNSKYKKLQVVQYNMLYVTYSIQMLQHSQRTPCTHKTWCKWKQTVKYV